VGTELDNVGSWLLKILYDNYDSEEYISSKRISSVLNMDESIIRENLDKLIKDQLVYSQEQGYRLSEKGYHVVYQREISFCPHL
jgi:Mn-dependent DtxR family transcriptional regulator